MSYAKQNIRKYQSFKRSELIKSVLYHTLEAITAVGIFILAGLYFGII